MINIMITLNIHNMRVMWLCSAEVVILMPQNHLGHLGGKFGCYFQGNTLLNKFVQVDSYITSKLTRRMVRAFDSVCAFDMLVMLWFCLLCIWYCVRFWYLSCFGDWVNSSYPLDFPHNPPNLDQFATMSLYICLRSKVYSIGYCSWKSQIESTWIVLRHFLAFVEAQLANWYKLGWFGSFELLRSHLSDLLQWSKVVFGCQFWKNHF